MKYQKILRWLGVLTILMILMMVVVPAAPALAAETLIITPVQAKVGDLINFSGGGYTGTTTTDYYLDIFMSAQPAVVNNVIDVNVTAYKKVVFGTWINESGAYSGHFNIPATLNEGAVGTAAPVTVATGTTYYLYASGRYYNPTMLNMSIKAIATLVITPGAALDPLSPATGQPGTVVSVTGSNFPASTALAIQFDGAAITPTSGDSTTRASGLFISTITIPSGAAAGAHTITVTAGTSTATATFTVLAAGTLDPLTPASGAAGIDLTVSGANFAGSSPIVFKFDTAVITPKGGNTQTGSGGGFASIITIPATATVGTHQIFVTIGATTVSKDFTVTSVAATTTPPATTPPATTPPATTPPATTPPATTPPPTSTGKGTITVVQNGQFVGATIGIGGASFIPGANVTIKWDDKEVASVKAAADSTFQIIFKVPPSQHGDRKMTISDGTNTVIKTFTVESVPPKVPPPLKPLLDAKVKSPVVFSWAPVTDDSMPITYRLQIATDKGFGASAIVLDKTGLDSSSYTLSNAEELKLSSKSAPYYWRVKAIDAAANESEWTGAGEFYAAGPYVFPRWALYLIIGGGALVLFLIGLWVGRRTAFYY